jgi:hypothetical protein
VEDDVVGHKPGNGLHVALGERIEAPPEKFIVGQ